MYLCDLCCFIDDIFQFYFGCMYVWLFTSSKWLPHWTSQIYSFITFRSGKISSVISLIISFPLFLYSLCWEFLFFRFWTSKNKCLFYFFYFLSHCLFFYLLIIFLYLILPLFCWIFFTEVQFIYHMSFRFTTEWFSIFMDYTSLKVITG